ncbi:hypothetical protein ACEPAI_9980 [Sanghuangporus weigelae]
MKYSRTIRAYPTHPIPEENPNPVPNPTIQQFTTVAGMTLLFDDEDTAGDALAEAIPAPKIGCSCEMYGSSSNLSAQTNEEVESILREMSRIGVEAPQEATPSSEVSRPRIKVRRNNNLAKPVALRVKMAARKAKLAKKIKKVKKSRDVEDEAHQNEIITYDWSILERIRNPVKASATMEHLFETREITFPERPLTYNPLFDKAEQATKLG